MKTHSFGPKRHFAEVHEAGIVVLDPEGKPEALRGGGQTRRGVIRMKKDQESEGKLLEDKLIVLQELGSFRCGLEFQVPCDQVIII
jgi:hypothetical protein